MGVIAGTPTVVIGKTEFTVTVRNARVQQSAKIAFAVADDWRGALARPDLWTVDMCLMWLREELELSDLDLISFLAVDGKHLVSLNNKDVLASKHPTILRHIHIAIASEVAT